MSDFQISIAGQVIFRSTVGVVLDRTRISGIIREFFPLVSLTMGISSGEWMTEKILLLEHEPPLRKAIGDALRAEGYAVTETGDGDRALELLNDRFDLVIADFVHPGVDGLKLNKYIHAKWPQTGIIFMTAYLSAYAAEALLQGRAEFLPKPINLAALLGMVRRLLLPPQS
jgi:DNA-binding NtrC family response regulator